MQTTGLTGLAVAQNPHHVLTSLYNKTLRALAKMPENAVYRKSTEEIVSKRLAVVTKVHEDEPRSQISFIEDQQNLTNVLIIRQNPSVPDVERLIGSGQVEELIIQAENELLLSRKMLGWKPWESLLKPAPAHQWQWPPAQLKGLPQN